MLPFSDLMSLLTLFDPMLKSTMIFKLFIQSTETDQYRERAWIVLASSGKATCPVVMMNLYLQRAELSCDSPLLC